jgi:hypothetical protein
VESNVGNADEGCPIVEQAVAHDGAIAWLPGLSRARKKTEKECEPSWRNRGSAKQEATAEQHHAKDPKWLTRWVHLREMCEVA